MQLHQLRYFLAVAKRGNFSRAAQDCFVAQPSLSQQILKLEAELGETLFARNRARATLTPAGELLRERAETILREVEEARREVRDAGGELRGEVHIAALPTIAPYLLPKILQKFARRAPAVSVTVHEETTDRALRGLHHHELDLALVSLPIDDPRLEAESLFTEQLFLALPPRHPLNRKRLIRSADLQPEKFIFMADAHCLGTQTLQFCYAQGFAPRISCRSAQMETLQALVAAGVGISIVPAMARNSTGCNAVVYRSLGKNSVHREIALLWNRKRHLSHAAEALRDTIREFCARR